MKAVKTSIRPYRERISKGLKFTNKAIVAMLGLWILVVLHNIARHQTLSFINVENIMLLEMKIIVVILIILGSFFVEYYN